MELVRFESPEWFLMLLVLPLLLYRYIRDAQGRKSSVRFSDLKVLGAVRSNIWTRIRHILIIFRLFALGCLITAMARPQSGRETRQSSAEGIDIVLTLDVSSSMELKDLDEGRKSRLEVAKEVIAQFVDGRESDRIGMVVFAGESFTQCPLTLDYGILKEFLGGIEIAHESWDGTAIGMAIVNACNRLQDSDAKSKVIILLTDGVNNKGEIDPLTAADVAAAVGIRVYAVGVGSDGSIRRPIQGIFGTHYQTLEVEIDEESLAEVAARTNGKYYRATSEQKLEEIYREIGQLETTEIKTLKHVNYSERFALFLWPGLMMLVAEYVLANTRFRRVP